MPRKKGQGKTQQFLRSLVDHAGNECVIWPFCKDNTGYPKLGNKGGRAHTVMCRLAHGDKPEGRPEAAHSCGNALCVNPNHLAWASRVENELDKLKTGTQTWGENHPSSVLTTEQVLAIYRDTRSASAIARMYGCSYKTVQSIQRGQTWAHTTGHRCAVNTVSYHLQQRAA